MVYRTQKLSNINNLFLFGARSTGKTTLLKSLFEGDQTLWIDLLSQQDEEIFGRHPDQLSKTLELKHYSRVVIDEIQKSPKLLDIVHREIEKKRKTQFVLTGSSARKLKRGAGNLLGGRAFIYHLYPLTFFELKEKFNLLEILQYGSLPKIFDFESAEDRCDYLRGYVATYIKEEILVEQLVRDLDPFRDFLEVAAQSNGKLVNFAKMSREVGVDDKTIRSYYQILEDTLVGFLLQPFHRSIRKRQREAPKFFFFDLGVKRAIEKTLRVPITPQTYEFGNAFEHFILLECFRLNDYLKLDYRFSYLRTKDNLEIDLIIGRPGLPELLIELKSTNKVTVEDTRNLNRILKDWDRPAKAQVWSNDEHQRKEGQIEVLHWTEALKTVFAEV
jgi:predicted AAA+ superfamily ATPase